MRILFIGGTGNISSAVSRQVLAAGHELVLLNRGLRPLALSGATVVTADIADEATVAAAIGRQHFDVVANFIAFTTEDIERDLRLFADRCGQYCFISSASAYRKPPGHPVITESTPLANPYWEYSRRKIACEERLMQAFRDDGFPCTIVRPSLTYETVIPAAIGGWKDVTILERMRAGLPIISHGDGSSLWTITHSEDFARGFVGLLGHQLAIGEVFHITADELLTWDQIYQAIAAAVDAQAELIHIPSDFIVRCAPGLRGGLLGDKAVSVVFDNSKIKRFVPGFRATIPFATGIRRTVAWFQADPARWVAKPETGQLMDRIIERYRQAYDALPES